VVLTAVGEGLVHKPEKRAVAVDLRDEETLEGELAKMEKRLLKAKVAIDGFLVQEYVRGGKETILGMNRDKVFGPLLAFGLGGVYVEFLKDVAWGLAPITDEDARRIVRSVRTYPLLEGVRGEKASDVPAVEEALLRLSQLVLDFEAIKEVDLNPLIVLEKGKGYKVVDARVVM
jgi:4-hydroxybutyryl-CoA synthetase (ADP-forming)